MIILYDALVFATSQEGKKCNYRNFDILNLKQQQQKLACGDNDSTEIGGKLKSLKPWSEITNLELLYYNKFKDFSYTCYISDGRNKFIQKVLVFLESDLD
jgi:hypothetical protein